MQDPPPTPICFPSPPSPSFPAGQSSLLCHFPDGVRQVGSYRRRGCRGWSTGPAGGVGPGGSRRRVPGPAGGWAARNPRPAEPRSRRRPARLSNTRTFRGAAPGTKEAMGVQERNENRYRNISLSRGRITVEWQRKPNTTMARAGARMVPNTMVASPALMSAMTRFCAVTSTEQAQQSREPRNSRGVSAASAPPAEYGGGTTTPDPTLEEGRGSGRACSHVMSSSVPLSGRLILCVSFSARKQSHDSWNLKRLFLEFLELRNWWWST